MRSKTLAVAFLIGAGPAAGVAVRLGANEAWASACTSALVTAVLASSSSAASRSVVAIASLLAGVAAFAAAWCGPAVFAATWPELSVFVRGPIFAGSVTLSIALLSALDARVLRPSDAA